jgi:N-acylglucosamine-6-phosphate 2-epimerase
VHRSEAALRYLEAGLSRFQLPREHFQSSGVHFQLTGAGGLRTGSKEIRFRMTFPAKLHRGLIVSCQAAPCDPLDEVETLRRIAVSVLRGGAAGLRANGPSCIAAFRKETDRPIIGVEKRIVGVDKRGLGGAPSITPNFAAATAVAMAGADVIALDCTAHRHAAAEPWVPLVGRIQRELQKPVLADIATSAEAMAAQEAGADAIATTLYGFTPETAGARAVNWAMVAELARILTVPLIVEGHITQPEEVRRALDLGAYSVVVGSAITRPESITARFVGQIPGFGRQIHD